MFSTIIENWELYALVVLAIYEVVARFIPTDNNWSIVHSLVKILDLIVKNKAKTKETDIEGKPKRKNFKLRKTSR